MKIDNSQVYLHSIETEVPPKYYKQDYVLEFFTGLEGISDRQKSFMQKIYKHSAIDKRHTVIEDYDKKPEDYTFYPKNRSLKPEPTTKQRNDLYIDKANELSLSVVKKIIENSPEIDITKVTHLITISCTGFSAPGFDLNLVKQLKLSPSTRRYHIGFMGCYAAFTGMDLARNICLSDPSARVLMVNVELCTIHFQQKNDLDNLVANALFADGVSAAFISADKNDSSGPKLILDTFNSQLLDESESDMAWYPGNHGFDMKLSAYVPRIIDKNIHSILENILKKSNLTLENIDIWAVHPGGKAILDKIGQSLNLTDLDLKNSYETLLNYGNMSSTTIMFILKEILNDEQTGNVLGLGFGPGLTVETGYFRKVLV